MIKNIVFDLGKVLIKFDPERYLIDLGYNGEKAKRIIKAIFNSREWIELDRGTINEKEAADKMVGYDPDLAEEIRDVMIRWYDILSIKEDTLEILRMIDKNRFNLFVLSNFHKKAFSYINNKFVFLDYFDGIVISADINYIKPEPEIYDILLDRYNLKAEETLFIDDFVINLIAAEKAGIKTIHFRDSKDLKEKLLNLGIIGVKSNG